MHRVGRSQLLALIHNIITCSRIKRHRSGTPINHSLETTQGQAQLAELICEAIDNGSRMVIEAEPRRAAGGVLGKWGVDEPVPATVPAPPTRPTG